MTRAEYINGGAMLTCKRGSELPQSRLNADLVREIRRNRHGLTAKQWAEKLGLHVRTIDAVRTFKSWRHVL